jgi:DNA polymerase-1
MSASLPPPAAADTLYVLDLSGFVFRAYHAVAPLSNSKGEPTHAVHGVASMLVRLIGKTKPVFFAVAMDTKEPSFRKEIFDAYKANRPPPPEDLSIQMERCKELCRKFGFAVYERGGVEADDLIATLTVRARQDGMKVVIVSADKDLLQLVGDGVVMYDSMREKVYGPAETLEKMGVGPERVRDLLSLMGDTSDNIPGVPSVGPKTAVKLLTEYGDLDGVFAHVDEVKGALKEKLRAHKAEAYLSRDLVTLKEDLDIPFGRDVLRYDGADEPALTALIKELELVRLVEQIKGRVPMRGGALADGGAPGAAAAPSAETSPSPASPAALGNSSALGSPPALGKSPAVARWESEGGSLAAPVAAADPGALATAVPLAATLADLDAFLNRAASGGALAVVPALENEDGLLGDVVGIGLAASAGDVLYVPIRHRRLDAPDMLPLGTTLQRIAQTKYPRFLTEDSKSLTLAIARAGAVLPDRVPVATFDALLTSYVLDPSRRDHSIKAWADSLVGVDLPSYDEVTEKQRGSQRDLAESDVERIARYAGLRAGALFLLEDKSREPLRTLGLEFLLGDVELPLARLLAKVERTGVRLDSKHLLDLRGEAQALIASLEQKAIAIAGHEFNLNAPRQLETILFDELKLPVIKKTKTARSTDHEVLEVLAEEHELPRIILEHRSVAKLLGTYIEALPGKVDPETGRVHTRFNQAVAATGRLSSTDPNLQNIPIRTELGRRIRRAFVPREGWSLLSADYSQIELRVLAHLSEDHELMDAFLHNHDVHARTATALFGVEEKDVTRDMRGAAKTVNFAVIYGQTQFALAKNLDITQQEAAGYISAFFARYKGVRAFMDKVVEDARDTGVVHTMLGRRRPIPDIQSKNRNLRMAAERVAGNTPIQGTAADIMKLAMIAVDRRMVAERLKSRMLLTVHDELVFEVAPEETVAMETLVRETMQTALVLKVPLVVGIGFGPNWDEAH